MSNRGLPLLGAEKMLLQGLPLSRLNVENLTDEQQSDLAGNAMVTTALSKAVIALFAAEAHVPSGLSHIHLPPGPPC